jgi:hypothetical protein
VWGKKKREKRKQREDYAMSARHCTISLLQTSFEGRRHSRDTYLLCPNYLSLSLGGFLGKQRFVPGRLRRGNGRKLWTNGIPRGADPRREEKSACTAVTLTQAGWVTRCRPSRGKLMACSRYSVRFRYWLSRLSD